MVHTSAYFVFSKQEYTCFKAHMRKSREARSIGAQVASLNGRIEDCNMLIMTHTEPMSFRDLEGPLGL